MAEKPDIVVSVDLGTTFTGVAWRTHRTPIQVVNDWPGSGDRGERKVPTSLTYNSDGSVSSWGFLCDDDDCYGVVPEKTRHEMFKLFLDETMITSAQQQGLSRAPQSTADARRYATDYLLQIYGHVKETIERQFGLWRVGRGWADMAVAFLFSVPTTWTRMETINSFKGLIRDAGFGVEGPRHSAQVDLTEAEAAAVAALKTSAMHFNMGSLFLAVDAGGGTTDLSLMRITSVDVDVPQISQVAAVKGVGIGSTLIDRAFARLVASRLAAWPDIASRLPGDIAVQMTKSHHFRTVKHKFGERLFMQPVFKIQMDGVSCDLGHEGASIEKGRMLFTMLEIQSLFDAQIEGVIKKITEQLNWLSNNGHSQQVDFIVLSGGLGSSAYVRDQIQHQLKSLSHPNAPHVKVIPCQDPQLVVVRGLLLDQQQRSETRSLPVLATRIARVSYGIVTRELYSAARHFNEKVERDEFDRKKYWAINQIEWLIRKGDTIDTNSSLVKAFQVHLAENDTTRTWYTDVIISQNESSFLPSSLNHAGVTKLCQLKSQLQGVEQRQLELKQKRGWCFTRGYKFYVCRFDIRVIVAPADLRFELWFNGQRLSGDHEPIGIRWNEAGLRAGPVTEEPDG